MNTRLIALSALVSCAAHGLPAHALDLGLEAELRLESSDNVGRSNTGAEEEGQLGYALLGVYGEQRGRFLQAGFSGELETRRLLSDEDAEASTLNNFYGAANLLLTRSFSWYFADVLGTVRTGDSVLPVSNDELAARRNVFVTGPSLDFSIDSFSQVTAQVLYFNQTQDSRDLAQLVTAQLDWRQDTSGGNTIGVSINDIYALVPEQPTAESFDTDSNRLSASAFWERIRGRMSWYASVGATRYDIDEETINGANAEFRIARQFTPVSDLTFSIGTDLSDENISTIDSLISNGSGVEPETPGIFQNNTASLIYRHGGALTAYQLGLSVSDAQYQVVSEAFANVDASLDNNRTLAIFGVLSRRMSARISAEASLRVENQMFENRPDESDSIVANASVGFQLNESFLLSAGVRSANSEGINTRETIGAAANGEFETVENRALLQLRWAPPSRATKEPVIQLKQLLR